MKEEIVFVEFNSFKEISKLQDAFNTSNKVSIDLRNLNKNTDRQRVIDFITGVAFGKKLKIKSINKEGVYLLYDNFDKLNE